MKECEKTNSCMFYNNFVISRFGRVLCSPPMPVIRLRWSTIYLVRASLSFIIPEPNDLLAVDISLSHTELLANISKRGNRAHLFQLYPLLCQIATTRRKGSVVWLIHRNTPLTPASSPRRSDNDETPLDPKLLLPHYSLMDLTANQLATMCLEEIGLELGAGRT